MTEIIGKIAVIDLAKRHMVIMDKDQILHPYTCAEPLDIILQKQKVGYFVKVLLDGDICKKIEFAPRPADWPFNKGSGKPFVPRNERLIVTQMLIKTYADLIRFDFDNPADYSFIQARKLILDAVEEDIDRVMRIGEQK
jgi:hypothetical protein